MEVDVIETGFECNDAFWDVSFPIAVEEEQDFYIDELTDEDFLRCIDVGFID